MLLADCHGAKITSTPAKPSPRPSTRTKLLIFSEPSTRPMASANSGVVELSTPETPESTVWPPNANSVNGMALPKKRHEEHVTPDLAVARQAHLRQCEHDEQHERPEERPHERDLQGRETPERELHPQEAGSPQQGEHAHPDQRSALVHASTMRAPNT